VSPIYRSTAFGIVRNISALPPRLFSHPVFLFNTGGKLGSSMCSRKAQADADFADGGTGSCNTTTSFATNATCTVDLIFSPVHSGLAPGSGSFKKIRAEAFSPRYLSTAWAWVRRWSLRLALKAVIDQQLERPLRGLRWTGSGNVYVADSAKTVC